MDWLKGSSLILCSSPLHNISYKKSVAGVASFAVVSAMVVPSVLATDTASGGATPEKRKMELPTNPVELMNYIHGVNDLS